MMADESVLQYSDDSILSDDDGWKSDGGHTLVDSVEEEEEARRGSESEDDAPPLLAPFHVKYKPGMAFMKIEDLRAVVGGKEIKCTKLAEMENERRQDVGGGGADIDLEDISSQTEKEGDEDDEDQGATVDEVANRMRFSSTEEWRPVRNPKISSKYEQRKERYVKAGCTDRHGNKLNCIRCLYWDPSFVGGGEGEHEMTDTAKQFITSLTKQFVHNCTSPDIRVLCKNYADRWNDYFECGQHSLSKQMDPVHVEYHFRECLGLEVLSALDMKDDTEEIRIQNLNGGVFIDKYSGGFALGSVQTSAPMVRLNQVLMKNITQLMVFSRVQKQQTLEGYSDTAMLESAILKSDRSDHKVVRRKKQNRPIKGLLT